MVQEVKRVADEAELLTALEDGAARTILKEILRLGPRNKELLLGDARQISGVYGVR